MRDIGSVEEEWRREACVCVCVCVCVILCSWSHGQRKTSLTGKEPFEPRSEKTHVNYHAKNETVSIAENAVGCLANIQIFIPPLLPRCSQVTRRKLDSLSNSGVDPD